jgi:hypothetical protein
MIDLDEYKQHFRQIKVLRLIIIITTSLTIITVILGIIWLIIHG